MYISLLVSEPQYSEHQEQARGVRQCIQRIRGNRGDLIMGRLFADGGAGGAGGI